MLTPAWDSGFTEHSIHGSREQRSMIQRAVRHTRCRRQALDVGAHIGLCAIALAELFTTVRAFEPVDENFRCLQANVPDNVLVEHAALNAIDGTPYRMELPEFGNSGCWRTVFDGYGQTRTIDSYMLTDVDFIKLDVEGAEGFVLLGAMDTLNKYKPAVLFEDNHLGVKFFGEDWIDPKKLLLEFGYRKVEQIHKNQVWRC